MFTKGFTVGKIFGVSLILDWGLSILLVLLAFNLGAGLLPVWHPDWSMLLTWSVAILAAVLFLVSVLLHEMSHALVGRHFGIPINSITLFIFGGAANMEDEPPSAKAEFFMAAVGPLTSFLIGAACTLAALPGTTAAAMNAKDALGTLGALSPLTTLLLWLGPTNIILGVFNMLPGFPLDGGRVLRSILWGITGDMMKATRWAALVGRAMGYGLMGVGGLMLVGVRVPYMGGSFGQGIWLAFIGWFLSNAATLSYRRVVLKQVLGNVKVASVMRANVTSVPPELDLASFAAELLLQSDQRAFPVVQADEQWVGLITRKEVDRVPRAKWGSTRVADVMIRAKDMPVLSPEDDTAKALGRMSGEDTDPVAVVKDGRVQGLLRRRDIALWLEGHSRGASA